jgi:hypothetical protein
MADKHQLNVRLSPEKDAVLRAAAYVTSRSSGELARDLLEEALLDYANRPAIQKAMEARAEHEAEGEGKLTRIPNDAAA